MTGARRREPVWLLRAVVVAVHHDQIVEHGGLPGIRDEAELDVALARPRHKWIYGRPTLPQLVAAYGYAIARNHPFVDGNKRASFLAMAIFAARNGHSLRATDAEIVDTITALASGSLSERSLIKWAQSHCVRFPKSR